MSIYYGVIKDNTVVLPEDVHLPDGITVEVRTSGSSIENPDQLHTEEEFLQYLVAQGILTEIRRPDRTRDDHDRHLIEVEGQPLSEMIIEERR